MNEPGKEPEDAAALSRLGAFLVETPWGGRGWSWTFGLAPDCYHVQLHRFADGGGVSYRGIANTFAGAIDSALAKAAADKHESDSTS